MNSGQATIVWISFALVIFAWVASPWGENINEALWTLPPLTPSFDENHAFRIIQEYVTRYPRRVLGSIESRQSTGYLHQYLQKLGYQISYSHFEATIAGRWQVGRNVLAFKAGQNPETVAVVAHYDTARTTYQGAMANGSGVGVMLELARVFSKSATYRGLLFIATDGTEWGMLGARDIARNYPERERIVAVLSLDHGSSGELKAISLDTVGQFGGYSPPWLREIARTASFMEGLSVSGPLRLSEHLDRAFLVSWTDQGPFLKEGIPAINLNGVSKDERHARAIYHSANDTIDNLKVSSIGKFGRVAERIVRMLAEFPASMPKESMGCFRLHDQIFVSSRTMPILHYLTLLPFAIILYFHVRNHARSLTFRLVARELTAFAGTVIPLLLIYFPIRLFHRLRFIPEYTLYPATPKDPMLDNPSWPVVSGVVFCGIAAAIICYCLVRYIGKHLPRPEYYASKIVLLSIFWVLLVAALRYNSYWAVSFLLLPAWVWAAVGMGQRVEKRLANRFLILAAGIVYYVQVVLLASKIQIGWNIFWYGIMALSTGLFSLIGYMLATAAVALGIRFLAIQSHGSGVVASKETTAKAASPNLGLRSFSAKPASFC